MENLIQLIIENIWIILLMWVLLFNKSTRPYGLIIIVSEIIWGFKWWIYFIAVLLSVFTILDQK